VLDEAPGVPGRDRRKRPTQPAIRISRVRVPARCRPLTFENASSIGFTSGTDLRWAAGTTTRSPSPRSARAPSHLCVPRDYISNHLPRTEGERKDLLDIGLEDVGVVLPITATHVPIPSVLILAKSVVTTLTKARMVVVYERQRRVMVFWIAFSDVIIVRRLMREGWVRYRWESRPSRRPCPIDASS